MTPRAPCSMTFHTGRIKGLVRAKPYSLLITKIIGRIGHIVFLQSRVFGSWGQGKRCAMSLKEAAYETT